RPSVAFVWPESGKQVVGGAAKDGGVALADELYGELVKLVVYRMPANILARPRKVAVQRHKVKNYDISHVYILAKSRAPGGSRAYFSVCQSMRFMGPPLESDFMYSYEFCRIRLRTGSSISPSRFAPRS